MAPRRRILVDPEDIEVRREAVASLPVVNAVLARPGSVGLLSDYLPEPDPRCGLEPARTIGEVVRNLVLGRAPLYGLAAWAASTPSCSASSPGRRRYSTTTGSAGPSTSCSWPTGPA